MPLARSAKRTKALQKAAARSHTHIPPTTGNFATSSVTSGSSTQTSYVNLTSTRPFNQFKPSPSRDEPSSSKDHQDEEPELDGVNVDGEDHGNIFEESENGENTTGTQVQSISSLSMLLVADIPM